MGFWKLYLLQLPRIILNKDGVNNTLCLRKTLWINYKCLNFRQAHQLPIWIYRHTKLNVLGKILIENDSIHSGMIRIGSMGNASRFYTIIENYGIIVFKDTTSIFRGCYINNSGKIIFEGQNLLSEGCTLKITDYLEMGKMSRFGSETYALDTDFHFAIDVNTGKVKHNTKGITIGEYNWFGTRAFIKKGVKTGFGLIVAAPNTVLTKDYSDLDRYTIIAGNPAKPIAKGLRRIFNVKEERKLRNFFKDNPEVDYVQGNSEGLSLDDYCANNEAFI